ncbi:hypothetical protein PIB30_072025 [Stylosanthes scabra]|uniref:Uncharacterized protein n=1 Tax=Stylosanthes scabra TaxID=79078 RepID=A0ABU6ZMM1_9FABA|nr:hypothetical protein [Stylosanthes scabra]
MKGEEVRVENIIADNIAVIAQGLNGKGKLGFPSTIYKLCKDARVPMREFKRTSRILQEKPITAKRMETTRLPRNVPQQQQDEDDEDEPMPQAKGGNEEDQDQQQYHQFQQPPQQHYQVKAIKAKQEELWNNTNRFHSQIRKEKDMLAWEIQEIRKSQINQTLINSQRADAEKNLEQAVEKQARELAEMRSNSTYGQEMPSQERDTLVGHISKPTQI